MADDGFVVMVNEEEFDGQMEALAVSETGNEAAMIVRALEGESLRQVPAQLEDGDLTCFRLASVAFRAHSVPPPKKKSRSAFMRSPALVRFAWERLPGFRDEPTTPLLALAAGVGEVDMLTWLRDAGCSFSPDVLWWAATHCHLEALRWLHAHGCPWEEGTCNAAARSGHLEVLRWVREQGCPWEASDICCYAALGCQLEVLQWARENGCPH